jgi:hypothetical protein
MQSIARTERDRSHVLDSGPNPIQISDVRMPDWRRTGRERKYDVTGPNHSGKRSPSASREIERGADTHFSCRVDEGPPPNRKRVVYDFEPQVPSGRLHCGISTISTINVRTPYSDRGNMCQ